MRKPRASTTEARPPESMGGTSPRFPRSFDEMNTGHMVFELQGSVGELKNAVKMLEKAIDTGFGSTDQKIGGLQGSLDGIRKIIWMVTGGALVIGAIVGAVFGIGIGNIGHFLLTLGSGPPT